MRVITWNRSFKGMPNVEDLKDDFDSEENETHATVLDKLLAWEKKLYDEVKVCNYVASAWHNFDGFIIVKFYGLYHFVYYNSLHHKKTLSFLLLSFYFVELVCF